jgi:hypothetical protein
MLWMEIDIISLLHCAAQHRLVIGLGTNSMTGEASMRQLFMRGYIYPINGNTFSDQCSLLLSPQKSIFKAAPKYSQDVNRKNILILRQRSNNNPSVLIELAAIIIY